MAGAGRWLRSTSLRDALLVEQYHLPDNVTQMSAFRRKSRKPRPFRAPGAVAGAPTTPRCLCIPMQGQHNPIADVAAPLLQWKEGTTLQRPQARFWCRASRQWLGPGAAGPCPQPRSRAAGRPRPGTARPAQSACARREKGLGPGLGPRPGLWGPSAGSGLLPAPAAAFQMCSAAPWARGIQPGSPEQQPLPAQHHPARWAAAAGEGAEAGSGWDA